MDVLSDAVTAARVGRPRSTRRAHRAPFAGWHPQGEGAGFHVVLQGSCWLTRQDGDPVPLGVGDVVFLPHACAHGLTDDPATPPGARGEPGRPGGSTVLLCGAYPLDRARTHPLLAELPEVIHLPARIGRNPALQAAVELLGLELDRPPSPGGDAAVPALLDLLLLYILRTWFEERPGEADGWAAALKDPAVAAALRAIHEDPARQWSVESLGRQGGLSRAAFARRFATMVGRPPLAYLTWWRLTTAARLLRDSDAPLSAIAKQVGYGSEHALAHAFKREYGLAPGAYRRD
ncbi:AraC family transcriptional regulator [Nonomuraea sp. LPB2021202275-12-8]|uniref:AraC family transcriptional regulator n=1 Tax=Nonomuraea sp. LPB2021202275-12-8 TaxID=3120159 RepID=UPI00300D4DF0